MPPKKKKSGTKKKSTKPPIVISVDNKLPALSSTKTTTLLGTVASSDVSSLTRLIAHYDYGSVLDTVDVNGSSPIHIAVKRNDIKTLQKLLEYKKIDINRTELPVIGGYTALHYASSIGQLEVMQLLLQAGANPNVKSNSVIGETPLQICCKFGYTECARNLIRCGASPELRDNFGNNSSFWAHKYQQDRLIFDLGLLPVRSATAEEFLALMVKRNPAFALPAIKVKKAKKSSDKKKKKG